VSRRRPDNTCVRNPFDVVPSKCGDGQRHPQQVEGFILVSVSIPRNRANCPRVGRSSFSMARRSMALGGMSSNRDRPEPSRADRDHVADAGLPADPWVAPPLNEYVHRDQRTVRPSRTRLSMPPGYTNLVFARHSDGADVRVGNRWHRRRFSRGTRVRYGSRTLLLALRSRILDQIAGHPNASCPAHFVRASRTCRRDGRNAIRPAPDIVDTQLPGRAPPYLARQRRLDVPGRRSLPR